MDWLRDLLCLISNITLHTSVPSMSGSTEQCVIVVWCNL